MQDDQNRITYFAETDFRNTRSKFGIKAKDRTRHIYVIGKTGMGKSTLLENMAAQDILNGEGLAVMDPHGSMAEKLLEYVPEHRVNDVVYFAPFDTDFPVSFNVLEDVGIDKRHLVASGLMSSFKKIWVDAWSARMEYILNNILLALLEYPDSTLLGVNRMLADKDFRKTVVDNIKDPSVKSFWVDEFAKYGDRYMQEAGAAIQNKIGQFTANPIIRNIIGQPKSSFDIRKLMDEKKILIMNLSKGRIGEQNANLLGGMLITKIYLGAMSRADVSGEAMRRLPNFYLYVDEFQSFASDSFADILSEARKYNLSLTVAHQYVEQMSEAVRAAIFGNVGTMIVFRVGAIDSEIFEKEFAPQFTAEDIVNLGLFQNYIRLMIDGVGSKPFSSVSMAPLPITHRSFTEDIIESSRAHNAHGRAEVELEILKWHEGGKPEKRERPPREEGQEDRGDRAFEPRPPRDGGFAPRSDIRSDSRPPRQFPPREPRDGYEPRPRPDAPRTVPAKPPVHHEEKREERREPPQPVVHKEYVEPERPRESLRSLLSKLSIEPDKPKTGDVSPKSEAHVPSTHKAEHRKNDVPSHMPLSTLKKTKTPDPEKLADLRALLQKVVPQVAKDQSADTVPPQKTERRVPTKPSESQQEVPEDVLRSILGN